MKKIEVVIRPEKVEDVKRALEDAGFMGMTLSNVIGRGRQKGITLQWRAGEYKVEFLEKVKIQLVVDDAEKEKAITTIIEAARTGKVGDGKIFVYPVEEVIRVRTGERGKEAV